MIYAVGLTKLSREEKIALVSQINTLNTLNLMNESARKSGLFIKSKALRLAGLGSKTALLMISSAVSHIDKKVDVQTSPTFKKGLEYMENKSFYAAHQSPALFESADNIITWQTDIMPRLLDSEICRLSRLEDNELDSQLYNHMKRIACLKSQEASDETITAHIVQRAAGSLGINALLYADPQLLEDEVFTEYIKEITKRLQSQICNMSLKEQDQLENALRDEIMKLSHADRETLKKTLRINELSEKRLVNLMKTGSVAFITQIMIGGFGFGAYLFITTFLKAVGLLFGITLSIGTYSAASAVLSFLLSAPFLAILLATTSGYSVIKINKMVSDEMAKMLVLVGKGKMLCAST